MNTTRTSGFSLVAVLVASVIMGLLAVALGSMFTNLFKAQKSTEQSAAFQSLALSLNPLFSKPEFCKGGFIGTAGSEILFTGAAFPISISLSKIDLVTPGPGPLFTPTHTNFLSLDHKMPGDMILTSIGLEQVVPYTIPMEDSLGNALYGYIVELKMKAKKTNADSIGRKEFEDSRRFIINVVPSGADAGKIVSCLGGDYFDANAMCLAFGGTPDATGDCALKIPQLTGSCAAGEFMVGFETDGSLKCSAAPPSGPTVSWLPDGHSGACSGDQVIDAYNCTGKCSGGSMTMRCHSMPAGTVDLTTLTALPSAHSGTCPAGKAMVAFNCGGSCGSNNMNASCANFSQFDPSATTIVTSDAHSGLCLDGYIAVGFDCTGDCGTNSMKMKCAKILP